MKNIKNILFIIAVIAIIGGIGWYFWNEFSTTKDIKIVDDFSSEITQSFLDNEDTSATSEGEGGVIETTSPEETFQLAPAIEQEIIFPDRYSKDAVALLEVRFIETKNLLENNPSSIEGWIDLGVLRRTAGDFKGAEEVLIFATLLNPDYYLAFANLGDLYGYYLRDVVKAEESFLKAIENAPTEEVLYRQFADYYRTILDDNEKAEEIMKQLE